MFAINSRKLLWVGVHPGVRLCNTTPPGAAPRAALGVCVGRGPFQRDSFPWKRCSCCKSHARRLCPPLRRGHLPLRHDTQPAAFPYVLFHPSPALFPPLINWHSSKSGLQQGRIGRGCMLTLSSFLISGKKKKKSGQGWFDWKSRYITQKMDAPHHFLCMPDICFQQVAIK